VSLTKVSLVVWRGARLELKDGTKTGVRLQVATKAEDRKECSPQSLEIEEDEEEIEVEAE
jgi:hypothetical protein